MDPNKTALERAFELARSGRCDNTNDIRRTLQVERFDLKQMQGSALAKQLRDVIRLSKLPVL